MNEISEKSFISFNVFFQALSSGKIIRAKNGDLKLSGTFLSSNDINILYLPYIVELLGKYEKTISPNFKPTKDLFSTLHTLSSPVLKRTNIPETLKKFYAKLNIAISSNSNNIEAFRKELTSYVESSQEEPTFMLVSMDKNLSPNENIQPVIKSMIPSSSTLIEGYGTKYNGEDILDLAQEGYINSKEPINMLIYKSLYAQDENSEDYIQPVSHTQLLEFYSPKTNPNRLHSLLANDQIDIKFSDLHSELLENVSSTERKEYLEDIIDESKTLAQTSSQYSTDLLQYSNANIIPISLLSGNISADFLKTKFKNAEITISQIIKIYESDPKYFQDLKTLLTPTEIEKNHSTGNLEDNSLMYLPSNSRISYLKKNNTKLSTIMYLFLHCNGLSITELQELLKLNNSLESLDVYIDFGSEPSRIKELYENYLLDYGAIQNLVTSGILKKSDLEKYKLGIPKDTIYDLVQTEQKFNITSSNTDVPFSTTGTIIGSNTINKTSAEKSTILYKILGGYSEKENINIPIISHKNENNNPGFLDEYKILPLKASSLFAFIPTENTKSSFLMPYQEAAYILNRGILPNLLSNPCIQEIKPSEHMHEDLLKLAYQFEETKKYLQSLGYSESLNFEDAIKMIHEEYIKMLIKGEN